MKHFRNSVHHSARYLTYAIAFFLMGCEGRGVVNHPSQEVRQDPIASEVLPENSLKVSEAIENFKDPSINSSIIDNSFTSAIENAVISNLEREAKAAGSPDKIGFTANTMRFSDSGKSLMITEFFFPGAEPGVQEPAHMTVIWWVSGGSLKRVYCADTSGNKVNWRKGACGEQVAITFDFKDWIIDP